jgi:ribosomal protein L17
MIYRDKNGNFTRIVYLNNRLGDNAPMAYIEFIGK